MNNIIEASNLELDEIVGLVNRNWPELRERPKTSEKMKTKEYWENIHRKGRIIAYKINSSEIAGFVSLLKEDKTVNVETFFVDPIHDHEGMTHKMIRIAEKIAVKWGGEHLSWMLSGKEDHEKEIPVFQQLGYVMHCPITQREIVMFEKKLN